MWKRILAYILFGLGLLTVTFFRRYSGEIIPYPFLFWLAGLIMFGVGIFLLRTMPTVNESKVQKQIAERVAHLRSNGEKIIVILEKCEIKEHNFIEERERYGSKNELLTLDIEREIQMWNAVAGNAISNVEQITINQSVIIFTSANARTGQTEKFISRVIPKDKITLSFYLDQKKQTSLYVDRSNRELYYFDLDFLDS